MWLREIEKYMGYELPQFMLVGNKADEVAKRAVEVSEAEVIVQ
jgi:hypothetical protein